jgi:alpha-amylase
MRNVWQWLCAACWLYCYPAASYADAIYQAFNEPFASLHGKLEFLANHGYRYIQLSPPQKSIDDSIWWGRYQPVDFNVIDGPLGNENDLRAIINHAHQLGLKVLIDVVLNHMADPILYNNSLNYPQFSARDFHFPDSGPCISNWGDRFQVTHFWLCGDPAHPERKLPDLDTGSSYVRGVHKAYLQKLINLGADGFRYDAVKHIEPEYFADVLRVVPKKLFEYGEVIGESIGESYLYTPYMKITDFHLLRLLLQVFSWGGDMSYLIHPEGVGAALPGKQSVVFSRNHDTVNNPNFFAFGSYQDSVLANAYVIGRGVGTVLVYREDAFEPTVAAAMKFHAKMQGEPAYVRKASDVCAAYGPSCEPANVLFIERGSRGLVIINKADQWLDVWDADLAGLAPGCYRETQFNFTMQISRSHKVVNWGREGRSGVHVGPRTALFFTGTSCKKS